MLLEYRFLEHFYTSNKSIYETILCECLNKSQNIVDLLGGNFSIISDQYDKQPDVVSQDTGYSIDFKLMISESLKEFQSRTAPIVQEIAPGVRSIIKPNPLKREVLLLWNCCKNMTEERLNELRRKKNMESKAVIHFFDKVLLSKKNILLFLPVYFSTVDKSLSTQLQHEYIFEELSVSVNFIYKYRQQFCSNYDTFIIYIVKTTNSKETDFIIAQFTENGLKYIDKIPMFSLNSTAKLQTDNTIF